MNPAGSESVILKLKNALPESILPWVIAALRQDDLVWERLKEPAFLELALSQKLSVWTSLAPANLALIDIHAELPQLGKVSATQLVDKLRADIDFPVDPALRKNAALVYESLRSQEENQKPNRQGSKSAVYSGLAQAGYLSLVLRERRRKVGSWQGFSGELLVQAKKSGRSLFSTWSTALACLYGIVPDPREMIQALVTAPDPQELYQVASHAILTNPLSLEKMSEEVTGVLNGLHLAVALPLLEQLALQRPNLLSSLGEWILSQETLAAGSTKNKPDSLHLQSHEQLKELESILLRSKINSFATGIDNNLQNLKDAWEGAQKFEASLAAELAVAYSSQGLIEQAIEFWQKAVCLAPHSPLYRAKLSLAFANAGRLDEANAWLPDEVYLQDKGGREHPQYIYAALAMARLAMKSGEQDAARLAALGAIDFLFLHDNSIPGDRMVIDVFGEMSRLLLELGLPVEAAHTAQAVARRCPNNVELLELLGKAQLAAGQVQQAAGTLQAAAYLSPNNLDLRRQLADYLEQAGDWQLALAERNAIVDAGSFGILKAPPEPDDLCALAYCALQAGEFANAAGACRQVLAMENLEEDTERLASAHLLLGQALEELGEPQAAIEHYRNATQFVPHNGQPWLALAGLQARSGETYLAMETLRAGAQAAPDAPGIYLALGEAYLEDWENHGHPSPTQALDMFQKANQLLTQGIHTDCTSKISLRLGETLHQLGHLKEAQGVLEPAYRLDPAFPGLAYAYGKVLLDLQEPGVAAPVLAYLLQLEPDNLNVHLDYATALLACKEQPKEAVASLYKVLELSPGHVQAQALLAEALSEDNQLELALRAYQASLETNLIEDPRWCSRISLGLGKVALALNQPDIAIAALQEASIADPKNPQIPCTLAEAYYAAGLLADSLQAARTGLGLALEDLDVLIWFAEKAIEWVGKPSSDPGGSFQKSISEDLSYQVRTEVLNTLTRALQLAPHRTDLLIRLGKVQLQIEDQPSALETFRSVLKADKATIEDLHQAACQLLSLKDPQNAVACLERALHLTGYTRGEAFGKDEFSELAFTLVGAYQQAGNPLAALAILDQAISNYPGDVHLWSTKANLLLEQGRPQEALASIEDAINIQPDGENTPDLHKRAAEILRATGDLPAALAHIERIIYAPDISPINPHYLWARILAADISRALLQTERAWNYLSVPPILDKEIDNFSLRGQKDFREYFQLRAELALEAGNEKLAEESLVMALEATNFDDLPVHEKVRLRAIESRLQLARCQHQAATQSFLEAYNYLDQYRQASVNSEPWRESGSNLNLFTLVESALELAQLDKALTLVEEELKKSPLEPLSHINLARALVLRAEAQRLHADLQVNRHAPGLAALGEEARRKFEDAIRTANEQIYKWAHKASQAGEALLEDPEVAIATIARWNGRGQAAFLPRRESCQAFSDLPGTDSNPDEVAALLAALRAAAQSEERLSENQPSGDMALITQGVQAARNYPLHPPVLAQLALALENDPHHIDEAYHAALSGLKNEFGEPDPETENEPATNHPLYVLYHVLAARLAYRSGDLPSSLSFINLALSCWPDEARWHALAAEIYRSAGDISSAIIHLEQAAELEPDYMPHHLKLGQSYLQQAQMVLPGGAAEASMNAIQILEKACELAPQKAEAWLSLARAYLSTGQENSANQAAICAERAINLDPDCPAPLVLRAEIALQDGEFQEAYDRALVASRLGELTRLSEEDLSQPPETDPYPILLLIRALEGLGRTAEAVAAIDKALPQVRERLPLLLERLQLISRSQEAEATLAALQELAQEYPEEAIVLSPLAKSLYATGDKENAIRAAQRALQAVTMPAESKRASYLEVSEQAELHLLLGRMLREAGQLDQAIHHLNEAVRQSPSALEAYLELGRAFQDRRQHMQALQVYNQAMEVAPTRAEPFFHAGLALKESKDYLGAESMLRKAVELAPTDLTIHRQLGAVVALNLVHNRRKISMDV
jgi:tetratricopeptide (TPR) repeat protein